LTGFARLVATLHEHGVRFVLIGVAGANHWARSGDAIFTTQDYDLLLPLDPDNALAAWQACQGLGLALRSGDEPLGAPLDRWLAEQVVARRALVRASDGQGLDVDLSLVMAGFDFDTVWTQRRDFVVDGVKVPVARLRHIVESKALAGREKDRLFLAAHADALRGLMEEE
jgi:hypothetical protein